MEILKKKIGGFLYQFSYVQVESFLSFLLADIFNIYR